MSLKKSSFLKLNKKMADKLRSKAGFSLGELLAAMLIMLFVGGILTGGLRFAVREYREAGIAAHSKVLSSTLSGILKNELSNTLTVEAGSKIRELEDGWEEYELKAFFSNGYANGEALSSLYAAEITAGSIKEAEDGKGELFLGRIDGSDVSGSFLVGNKTYSELKLKAGADLSVKLNKHGSDKKEDWELELFHVDLKIYSEEGEELLKNSFDVFPLNRSYISFEEAG